MTRDLTLGATWRRLIANGYAPTSASHPDRIVSQPSERDSFIRLAEHPAAVFCRPTAALGCELEDAEQRQVLLLVLTAYLLSDAKQWKAVQPELESRKLLSGPHVIDSCGNRVHVLRYSGQPIFDGEQSARLAFDADDSTVLLEHAIAPGRQLTRTDPWGNMHRVASEPVGSHVIALDGEWKSGDLLSTPRSKLPELLAKDLARLIPDVELARWEARPAAARVAAA
jgi:hypothetical protein